MPLDAKTTSVESVPALSPGLDHQGLDGDDLVGSLVPVIGAHHQQHLLAPITQAPDGIDDVRDVRVRRSHQRAMLGRSRAP